MNQWLKRGAAATLALGLLTIGASAVGMGPGAGEGKGLRCSIQSCRCTNDGVCDRLGQGAGFVDANGDGICDHRTDGGTGWRGGRGK